MIRLLALVLLVPTVGAVTRYLAALADISEYQLAKAREIEAINREIEAINRQQLEQAQRERARGLH